LFRNGAHVPIVSRIAIKMITPRAVSLTAQLYRRAAAASVYFFPRIASHRTSRPTSATAIAALL